MSSDMPATVGAPEPFCDCIHLELSPTMAEVRRASDDERLPDEYVWWCLWGENNPDRLLDAPRWVTQEVLSGGGCFTPKKHCVNCPGYVSGHPAQREGKL